MSFFIFGNVISVMMSIDEARNIRTACGCHHFKIFPNIVITNASSAYCQYAPGSDSYFYNAASAASAASANGVGVCFLEPQQGNLLGFYKHLHEQLRYLLHFSSAFGFCKDKLIYNLVGLLCGEGLCFVAVVA
jgi:hypothetical protein